MPTSQEKGVLQMHTEFSPYLCETSPIRLNNQLFAIYVQHRRLQLCMNCEDAAELAGLQISQWISLEQGWIPDLGDNIMSAVAGTLETRVDHLNLLVISSSDTSQSLSGCNGILQLSAALACHWRRSGCQDWRWRG
jgi:hypothetical protein